MVAEAMEVGKVGKKGTRQAEEEAQGCNIGES